MNKSKSIIAGALSALFIASAASITAVSAEEPLAKGTLETVKGVPLKSYPVIIKGRTNSGNEYSTYTTTDDEGNFEIFNLPPGQYEVQPAGEPQAAQSLTVRDDTWKFWSKKDTDTANLGVYSVSPKY